jgi:uncharacterized protein (TIGR02302 family)
MFLLVWTGSRLGLSDRIERLIALARAAIAWERVWPALWPASGILGAFAALALLGAFAYIPSGLHTLALLGILGASGYFLYRNLESFRAPDWSEGARRLERESGLAHRPITERHDRLAVGQGDDFAEGLWRAHVKALLARHDRLRLVIPRSALARRDPYALRFVVLLLLLAGFALAGSDWGRRLNAGFSLSGGGAAMATMDAWIDPPAYTGEAPLYLPHGDTLRNIAVPEGSALVVQVHGSRSAPQLSISPAQGRLPAFAGQGDNFSTRATLRADATISVRGGGAMLGNWRIKAIPDEPPAIAFASPPSQTERDALKLAFTAGDDYGVTSARALIRPVAKAKNRKTLMVDLPLASSAKTINQTVYRDLTGHPYAGLDVEITLEAKDGAGHVARSKSVRFKLPAHVFTNPLARALIEQRQALALDARVARNTAMRALDALTLAPDRFYENNKSVYLALRSAFWALKGARTGQDIARVQDLLWQTAQALERGGLSSAAEELRRLQQLISQALAQGAPQEVIDALLQRYQMALNRYLQMLAQNPPSANQAAPPGAKVLKPEDLQTLLNAIQQLAQTGAREQAQQLLAMLQNLLENLHMTAGPGGNSPEDKALSDAIQGLGDLTGKQRELLDKTFREQQGNPDPKSGGTQGLAQQQGQLRQQLDKLMQGLGKQGGSASKDLGNAGKQMGEAQGDLGNRALDNATEAQRNALDALRKGAASLAKNLMDRNGQQGPMGSEDPLGRQSGGRGPSLGSDVKIPDQSQLQRARSILKELRRRAEERGRPKEELDYFDRLLKQF